jgi:hypothetical protein
MKSIVPLIAICMLSCASNRTTTNTPIDETDYMPPTDFDMSWDSKVKQDSIQTEQELSGQEEVRYQQSVAHIQSELSTEKLNIQACIDLWNGKANKQCFQLIKKYCEEDTLLDTRQNHYVKPYCAKSFVDFQDPSKRK